MDSFEAMSHCFEHSGPQDKAFLHEENLPGFLPEISEGWDLTRSLLCFGFLSFKV